MKCKDKLLCSLVNFEILVGQPFATRFEGWIRLTNKKNKKNKIV
jgi:hypothetical protein